MIVEIFVVVILIIFCDYLKYKPIQNQESARIVIDFFSVKSANFLHLSQKAESFQVS